MEKYMKTLKKFNLLAKTIL